MFRKSSYPNLCNVSKKCPKTTSLRTVILKSSLLHKNKLLFPRIETKEDYVLWLKIIKKIKTIRGLDIKLTYYRKTKVHFHQTN